MIDNVMQLSDSELSDAECAILNLRRLKPEWEKMGLGKDVDRMASAVQKLLDYYRIDTGVN